MTLSVTPVVPAELQAWRDLHRHEMHCQIVCDALSSRTGWTLQYLLRADTDPVGYAIIAIGGPWFNKPAVVEFYLLPHRRTLLFPLFEVLRQEAKPVGIEAQSNDRLLSTLLHTHATDVQFESLLFQHSHTPALQIPRTELRRYESSDHSAVQRLGLDEDGWVLEFDGQIVATGGVLYHYNRPYGDVYMTVAPQNRRHGFGSYLVQELKRICFESGSLPAARCNPSNVASRATLLKAGFTPCAQFLVGKL